MAATDTRHRTTWGTRFRLLVRAAGLTGVLAVAVGAALFASAFPSPARWNASTLQAAGEGAHGTFARAAAWTFAAGLAAVAIALAVEVVGGFVLVAGRRTAANTAATVGTVAALALLFFVNAYSFKHHSRYDLTRDKKYTLPGELAERLRTLRPESPTTIVVLQNHNLFGSLSAKRDSFTKAAEEKVTEKVRDLVDLFRELGPRFNVVVLDTEAYGYDRQLAELTRDAPELKAAIETAPENSILFHANKHVQRLTFNEFLQLDKTAGKEANGGRGNLVLLPQGVENFSRRVLAVQERRPRVAVCVVHEWLSTAATAGQGEYSVGGLRRALEDQGYEVIDIILKKNWDDGGRELEPAAYTVTESRLERLEAELDAARAQAAAAQRDLALVGSRWRLLVAPPLDEPAVLFADLARAAGSGGWGEAACALAAATKSADTLPPQPFRTRAEFYVELVQTAQTRGWAELVRSFRQWLGEDSRPVTEDNEASLRAALLAGLSRQAGRAGREVEDAVRVRAEATEAVRAASGDERLVEGRRQADVKAKFATLLKDVDLLVIPRFTLVNATIARRIDPELHTLSKPQVEVIKDFMKQGKPVLACLGSLSGPNGFDPTGVDELDRLVAERGVELGRDTVLYDAEAKAFAAIKAGRQLGGGADIPPLTVAETGPDAGRAKANPVGAAYRLTGRSVDQKLDLRLAAPRPVYLAPGVQDRLTYAAEFVFTGPDSWNEERPFITRAGRSLNPPRYDPPVEADANAGRSVERRGPFPVGVAVEGKVPASWYDEAYDREQVAAVLAPLGGLIDAGHAAAAAKLDRPTQRLVVFGSGNLFSGPRLEPAQEKLLLHSANWLTGRADRLPRADLPAWEFPRVRMTEREFNLWRYGTAIGLPLAAVYLGLMATMVRRMR